MKCKNCDKQEENGNFIGAFCSLECATEYRKNNKGLIDIYNKRLQVARGTIFIISLLFFVIRVFSWSVAAFCTWKWFFESKFLISLEFSIFIISCIWFEFVKKISKQPDIHELNAEARDYYITNIQSPMFISYHIKRSIIFPVLIVLLEWIIFLLTNR